MSDLINGKTPKEIKAALVMCSEICFGRSDCPYYDGVNERCQTKLTFDALALIERLEVALKCEQVARDVLLEEVPKWISVKTRLPEKGDKVLISLCGCNVKEAKYRGDGVFEAAYVDTYHVTGTGSIVLTHWMPMPEPHEVSE